MIWNGKGEEQWLLTRHEFLRSIFKIFQALGLADFWPINAFEHYFENPLRKLMEHWLLREFDLLMNQNMFVLQEILVVSPRIVLKLFPKKVHFKNFPSFFVTWLTTLKTLQKAFNRSSCPITSRSDHFCPYESSWRHWWRHQFQGWYNHYHDVQCRRISKTACSLEERWISNQKTECTPTRLWWPIETL